MYFRGETCEIPTDIQLTGEHNRYNCAVVYALAKRLGLTDAQIVSGIRSFSPLPHRLSLIGTYHGIRWYDDSISTACETCIQALNSLPDTDTVLIGGMDRGIDYTALIDFVKAHPEYQYIFSYESGKRIYEDVGDLPYTHLVADLKESVDLGRKITPEGKACILSPAAASYTHFKDFEARGNKFCQILRGETTLVFTGDIGFDRFMDHRWEDPNLLSKRVRDVLSYADHVIANVEGPIMDCPKNARLMPVLSS
jgi:UDP-N-acetylmuramoylalanine--D-glutamate ligase